MAKFTPVNIASGFQSTDALNTNFDALETLCDTLLSRDGTSPNTMAANLDMNSNRILNLPYATNDNEPVTLAQLSDIAAESLTTMSASLVTLTNPSTEESQTLANYINNRSIVYVDDFGADPSGTTDSGAAILAAIAALPSGGSAYGGIVQFGKGVYRSDNTKVVIPNGVWLNGEGAPATQLKCGNSFNQTCLVENEGTTGIQEYAYISNMLLDGNRQGGAQCTKAVINFTGLFVNSFIRDCVVLNGSNHGIMLSAIGSPGGAGPVIVENTWSTQHDGHCIYLHCDATSTNSPTGYHLTNVTAENCAATKSCVYVDGNSKLFSVIIRNLHTEQGRTTTAGTYGLTLDGCADFVLDGAQMLSANTGVGGILITNNASNVRFRFHNITNINTISPMLTDNKNSVTFSGGYHIPFYASPEFGIHQDRVQTLSYGTTVNTDLTLGNYCTIVATNTTAFTIANPTNAQVGEKLTYEIVNASGGSMGAITWGTNFVYKDSWTNPANSKRKTITFVYRGSNSWAQVGAASGDM